MGLNLACCQEKERIIDMKGLIEERHQAGDAGQRQPKIRRAKKRMSDTWFRHQNNSGAGNGPVLVKHWSAVRLKKSMIALEPINE